MSGRSTAGSLLFLLWGALDMQRQVRLCHSLCNSSQLLREGHLGNSVS